MYPITWPGLITLIVVLGLVGCSAPATPSAGQAGSPRPLIARIGDTPAAVQRAMGRPDTKQDVANPASHQSVWTYYNYYQQVAQQESTGWTEVLAPAVYDPQGKVVQAPVTREIYRTQAEEDIEVTFKDGVVSDVEHLQ